MKKENDEITDLFRTRLADAGMSVRDGFWEELSQEIPVACQHRRRILLFRVAAAASVLLVLAASSATFLYFSPKGRNGRSIYKDSRDKWRADGWRWNTRQSVTVAGRTGVAETGSESLTVCCHNTQRKKIRFLSLSPCRFLFLPPLLQEMATDMVIKGITAFGRQQTVIRNHLLLRKNNRM